MQKNNGDYWACRRNGTVLAHGPKETFPNAEQRKALRAGELKIYVEGKLHREDKKC